MPPQSQRELKQDLVDAIRMLEKAEYIDHNGHCSARRDENSFYINSGASMRASRWPSVATQRSTCPSGPWAACM